MDNLAHQRTASVGAPGVDREYTGRLGAPRLDFDLDQVFDIGKLCPSDGEIAAFFGCAPETIARRKKDDPAFLAALQAGNAAGRLSWRRKLRQTAMLADDPRGPRGAVSALIFGCKQPEDKGGLGMTDRMEHSGTLTLDTLSRVAAAAKTSAEADFGGFAPEGVPQVDG